MSEDLSQVACACASWDSGTGTGCPWDFRVLVLLSEPYPGYPDNDDPEEGRRIVEAVKAAGGWVRVEHERILLRWRGDFPAGSSIKSWRPEPPWCWPWKNLCGPLYLSS